MRRLRWILVLGVMCAMACVAPSVAPAQAPGGELDPACQAVPAPPMQLEIDRRDLTPDGTVVVSPPRIDVPAALAAGDQFTCTITIRNRRAKAAQFTLEPRGIVGAQSGLLDVRMLDAGDPDADATALSWLTPQPARVTIRPGQLARVPVVVTVPTNPPTGGVYGAIDVVSRARTPEVDDTDLGIESRVQVAFLLRVGGEGAPKLKVSDVRAPKLRWDRDPWTLRAELANTGTLHAAPRGRVRIRSLFGSTLTELPVSTTTLLPGAERTITTTWDRVPWFGLYRYDLRVSAEGSDPARASGWFVALPPWWALAIAAVAAALAVVGWFVRRRGQHDDNDALIEFDDGFDVDD